MSIFFFHGVKNGKYGSTIIKNKNVYWIHNKQAKYVEYCQHVIYFLGFILYTF